MTHIHPTAIIEPGATVGTGATIEAYAVVKSGVVVGDKATIKSHVYLDGNTTIGEGTVIYPFASIGTKTQDKKFRGEKTYVHIGKNCEVREYVTINSSCNEGSVVRVGDNCLIMAYCHLAHNCEVGNGVIMANSAMLAGHVVVEDYAIIGGMTPIHQFSRVGKHAMVGGFSRITHDIPPYTIGAGVPYKLGGLNIVGLKRHNFPIEIRRDLSKAFKLVYRSNLHLSEALGAIEEELEMSEPLKHWLEFCRTSTRGLIGLQGVAHGGLEGLPDIEELLEEEEEVLEESLR